MNSDPKPRERPHQRGPVACSALAAFVGTAFVSVGLATILLPGLVDSLPLWSAGRASTVPSATLWAGQFHYITSGGLLYIVALTVIARDRLSRGLASLTLTSASCLFVIMILAGAPFLRVEYGTCEVSYGAFPIPLSIANYSNCEGVVMTLANAPWGLFTELPANRQVMVPRGTIGQAALTRKH